MNPLLREFIIEARDLLQSIAEKVIELEGKPDNLELMKELFRYVHTLKGNSGLFDFPEMTRVLHTAEDLMDALRDGRLLFSRNIADRLLEVIDFISLLIEQIEKGQKITQDQVSSAQELVNALKTLIPVLKESTNHNIISKTQQENEVNIDSLFKLTDIPEEARQAAFRAGAKNLHLFLIKYCPEEECFFKGEDPFFQARNTPSLIWGGITIRSTWPPFLELDCYRCVLNFNILSTATRSELENYFRYVLNQVKIIQISPMALIIPQGEIKNDWTYEDFVKNALILLEQKDLFSLKTAVQKLLENLEPNLWVSSALRWLIMLIEIIPDQYEAIRRLIWSLKTMEPPNFQDLTNIFKFQEENTVIEEPKSKNKSNLNEVDRARVIEILSSQCKILTLPDDVDWIAGRLKACAATIIACLKSIGEPIEEIEEALAAALQERKSQPLANWLNAFMEGFTSETIHSGNKSLLTAQTGSLNVSYENNNIKSSSEEEKKQQTVNAIRADLQTGKFLKVDQAKIDRLMNLISEMVVAKNALPYLANRAEKEYGAHSFSKEIKNQYTIINRITQEMQDAIMQVRMMPVSFIFQRFSRLVRDISHKLGKEVDLVIEGEETEADKDIIEMLADPLIHIIRNSLDHGLESPDERSACGKPTAGRLTIRAIQESDRLIIEIIDDGRGIDLNIVKRVAYEKGVIDEIKLETISDQEAINLIFLPGFSTAKITSDLSGRGVGMDVVRNTINKLGGTIDLKSEIGKGTTVRLSIPFSLAVTNVMIIETGEQIFGVPMEFIVESVRIVDSEIRTIKRQKTSSLRGRIVPILALNDLLNLSASPRINEEGKYAVLIVKVGTEEIGLLVDDFHEVIDVILKPMPGHLGKISYYAGTAILGDGSVLLVLNLKELINGHRI